MRGFFLGAMVLVGLDVVLNSPGSRIAALMTVPTEWLAKWMDPRLPLIPQKATAPAAAPNTSPGNAGGVLGAIGAAGGNPYATTGTPGGVLGAVGAAGGNPYGLVG